MSTSMFTPEFQLPVTAADAESFVRRVRANTAVSCQQGSDSTYLSFNKFGDWVAGPQSEPLAGAVVAVNPFSILHGWTSFSENALLGKVMVPVLHKPLPLLEEIGPEPEGGKEWQLAFSAEMLVLDTDHDDDFVGKTVRYDTSTYGGRSFFARLMKQLLEHIEEDPSTPVAAIELLRDSYEHKTRGRIMTPDFRLIAFYALDDDRLAGEDVESEPEPEPEPVKKVRRRTASAKRS